MLSRFPSLTWNNVLKFSDDIGMFTINRPILSCTHYTAFCRENCYNKKLYRVFPNMRLRDDKNEAAWCNLPFHSLFKALNRKKKDTSRIRLMGRGEAFSTIEDFQRVETILELAKASNRKIWIPTRAWRNPLFLERLIALRNKYKKHARILLSLDPSNFDNIQDMNLLNIAINVHAFSTMFFGDDTRKSITIGGVEYSMFVCPKTHKHIKYHCIHCKGGCFNSRQKHIHLKAH